MTAVENGADSVYFGVKGLNMRNLAENFDVVELKKVMRYLHDRKKRGYLALNVIVYDSEINKVKKILLAAKAAKVDAVILWDMAVLDLAKKIGLPIHLSTQASVANRAAVSAYARLGVRRIVLARECALPDIKKIVRYLTMNKIRCDIETFIHGAMCVSISGRCFMSQAAFARSANRGECIQPCRREYLIKDVQEDKEFVLGQDYVLSPKDLCAIDFIDQLIKSGIRAFKIEGRMRPPEYIKTVVAAYRAAIDAYFAGELTAPLKADLRRKLGEVYNRGFSDGFYFGPPRKAWGHKLEHTCKKVLIGEVRNFYSKLGVVDVIIQNKGMKVGDQILVIGKSTSAQTMIVGEIQREHKFVQQALKGEAVGLKVAFAAKPKDKIYLWQAPKSAVSS